ncbi:Hypothetical predicted protein, partial [Scomber scombrus]
GGVMEPICHAMESGSLTAHSLHVTLMAAGDSEAMLVDSQRRRRTGNVTSGCFSRKWGKGDTPQKWL